MALNWYLSLRNLAKTDAEAAALMEQLKQASTDDEKETAKQNAQAYLQKIQSNEIESDNSKDTTLSETPVVDTPTIEQNSIKDIVEGNSEDEPEFESSEEESSLKETAEADIEDKLKFDLSQPAFNPRLAKYGITREEELFLHGLFVRKLTRDEKILIRRSIYQKKNVAEAKMQSSFRQRRIEQRLKDAQDPEKQKYHQKRRYVAAIVNALEEHKNLGWMFSEIEGLTPEIFRELVKEPGNVNAFTQVNANIVENFYKKYGK